MSPSEHNLPESGYVIRTAVADDLVGIGSLADSFLKYSGYAQMLAASEIHTDTVLLNLIESGSVFVAELGGKIVGGIAATMSFMWFAPDVPLAVELAWFVDEKYRHNTIGVGLLRAFEKWGREQGARFACLSELVIDGVPTLGPSLGRLGYRHAERAHIKEL